jgi:hypothetical protein
LQAAGNAGIISKIKTGEAYFTDLGSRAFSMLSTFVESVYTNMELEKIIFLDNIDLYTCFLRSSAADSFPDRFYTIETSTVQKNVSSSREAVFEKNFCDMGFLKSGPLRLALDLSTIAGAFQKLYSELNIPFKMSVYKNDCGSQAGVRETLLNVLKSLRIPCEEKFSSELDEFTEAKACFEVSPGEFINSGFLTIENDRIVFSLTGGLERILKKVFINSAQETPFIINPFQLVIITDRVNMESSLFSEIKNIDKRGYSVIWHECGNIKPPREAEMFKIAADYLKAHAHTVLIIPEFADSTRAFMFRGNQKISGMGFFQLLAIYLQKSFKGNY